MATPQEVKEAIINALNSSANGANNLAPVAREYLEKKLLFSAQPRLVMQEFAQKANIPKKAGTKITFTRYEELEKATKPLVEGVTPEGQKLTRSTISTIVKDVGDYILLTDRLEESDYVDNVKVSTDLCGRQAAKTLDTLIRDGIIKGTNVLYSGSATSRGAITEKISADMIHRAVRILEKKNAPKIKGSYIGFIDPDTAYDIMNDPLFLDCSKYNGGTKIYENEIGKLHGVRFIETTETAVFENASQAGKNVHCCLIFGEDAYGVTSIADGSKPEIIIKGFGSGGTDDALNQRASVGWKANIASLILNEDYIIRLEYITTLDS